VTGLRGCEAAPARRQAAWRRRRAAPAALSLSGSVRCLSGSGRRGRGRGEQQFAGVTTGGAARDVRALGRHDPDGAQQPPAHLAAAAREAVKAADGQTEQPCGRRPHEPIPGVRRCTALNRRHAPSRISPCICNSTAERSGVPGAIALPSQRRTGSGSAELVAGSKRSGVAVGRASAAQSARACSLSARGVPVSRLPRVLPALASTSVTPEPPRPATARPHDTSPLLAARGGVRLRSPPSVRVAPANPRVASLRLLPGRGPPGNSSSGIRPRATWRGRVGPRVACQDACASRSLMAGRSTGVGSSGVFMTMVRSMCWAGRWNIRAR
jgi:hypothetical protein